ncbi:hypothetical protein OROGR_031981 [Orobanche gracilis]
MLQLPPTICYYHQFLMGKNSDRSILPPIIRIWHINWSCNFSKFFDTPHLLSSMARVYDKISDLNPIRDNWSILVRIIRLWVVRVGNQITAIEMILMDDKGSRIQATVRKYLAHKHERLLREGSVYAIRNFTLADNSGAFKVANHEYKITWQSETTALLQSDALVPPTMYSFVDFGEVVAGVLDDTILVDVIGLMTRVGEQRDFEGGKRMKQIELDNFGVQLTCSFWGHYVDELDAFLAVGDLSNVVVVIMCGKIKEFQGKRTIQNGLHCCKLMFNPTFPAAVEFKEKILQRQNSPSQGLGRIVDTSQSTLEDDFLNFNGRKTLAELKENGIYADCCYIVEATIKYLVDPQAWWYNVCTCNKAVQADGLSYYCGPCGRRVVNAKPRYRIKVKVIDETDSTNFVIFDRPAAMLLNRSCSEVIESCEKDTCWSHLSCGGHIVLNVASSGIASLLLPGGRTAHSRFCIPIAVNDLSTCSIKQGSLRAKLLQQTRLIIWDEAPMLNRHCFEALDRSLRDLLSFNDETNANKPFGGIVVVLGGDFRQILPVIRKGSRQDIISFAINSSDIWKSCTVLKLSKNMRLTTASCGADLDETVQFADWILKIGEGCNQSNESGEYEITILDELLIKESPNPLQDLVDFTYPDLIMNMKNSNFFEERSILCPTLDAVQMVNDYILSTIPGDEVEYLSADRTCISDKDSEVPGEWFTTEFLNDIKCSGIPNHVLKLKIGVPVMLIRNIDQSTGLCNGTRLIITELLPNVIGATVITGTNVGDKIWIPRMSLVPSDPGYPFKFERRQFPLSICFAMTINKSQGQSLSNVGLFLRNPVFTHGQLYVAVSRVRSKRGLKILILDDEGNVASSTQNVVYNEVFENL